ncbi:MAG: 30S ribosomal protein S9 [Rickettsiales bacterium]
MSSVKEKILEVNQQDSNFKTYEKVQDSLGRSYATGKRKNAIAKVWIKKGNGKITVNKREVKNYFGREILVNIAKAPLGNTKNENKFDIVATIVGGGKSGQAGALSHGISKALILFDPSLQPTLRTQGFLTRDPRVVERKKYGLKKARKGRTYRKR